MEGAAANWQLRACAARRLAVNFATDWSMPCLQTLMQDIISFFQQAGCVPAVDILGITLQIPNDSGGCFRTSAGQDK